MTGINNSSGKNVIINNYYGTDQQGMMAMRGLRNPRKMMVLMFKMLKMMMLIMKMAMNGSSEKMQENPEENGVGIKNITDPPFSPDLGNCIGNFMGTPGISYGQEGTCNNFSDNYYNQNYSNQPSQINQNFTSGSNGSAMGAVNLARSFLGRNSIDIKGEMPHFTAAGGNTNNCADFVSSCLESQGLLKGHEINVERLEMSLIKQGYKKIRPEEAQARDVWISNGRGHTELVQGTQNGQLKTIGSNNVQPGFQKITERQKDLTSGIVYSKR